MKKYFVFVSFVVAISPAFSQEMSSGDHLAPVLSKAFEHPDAATEIARLKAKREALIIRLGELEQSPQTNAEEIERVKSLIQYIDGKVNSLQNYLDSVAYANENGMPQKGSMSDEEYEKALLAWKQSLSSNSSESQKTAPIKTTLTREEFERLPKERQERILSMPERYTILN